MTQNGLSASKIEELGKDSVISLCACPSARRFSGTLAYAHSTNQKEMSGYTSGWIRGSYIYKLSGVSPDLVF